MATWPTPPTAQTSHFTNHTYDIAGNMPDLSSYNFASVSGTATLTGFYVSVLGQQITEVVSYAITTNTSFKNLAVAAGYTDLPTDANNQKCAGFIGVLSGSNLYWGLSYQVGGSIIFSPQAGYPQKEIGQVCFGRFNPNA